MENLVYSLSSFIKPHTINDVHSRLNRTLVFKYLEPRTKSEIVSLVRNAAKENKAISISGGRHAMGGQQFGSNTIHLNMNNYNRVIRFDASKGLITVESGIQWPKLIKWLIKNQDKESIKWGIRQKQTGADNLSIGGSVSANIHGRGLSMRPFISDIESLELVDSSGNLIYASRQKNSELFSLVVGGYGLFGVVTEVTLRLAPRIPMERKVEILSSKFLIDVVKRRMDAGFLYGDYQFKTDENAADFLRTGVFSSYSPITKFNRDLSAQRILSEEKWNDLYKLAHLDKAKAFQVYSNFYLSTDGQQYWSDAHQLSYYTTGLDEHIDQVLGSRANGSLMITELYVPRSSLDEFLYLARKTIRNNKANLVYGTVRFVEKDSESFLAWASKTCASIVLNLRVTHDDDGICAAKQRFQSLIDIALNFEGSYYLTYHRWARKDQVLAAYPQFPTFLKLKLKYDPSERFQSDWYRHYKNMFTNVLERYNYSRMLVNC